MPLPSKKESTEDTPLGQSIRDLINPVLEDPRSHDVQSKMMDEAFANLADNLFNRIDSSFKQLFNAVSRRAGDDEGKKIEMVTEAVTMASESGFPTLLRLQMPFSPDVLKVTNEEVRQMPGYIKLHEVARKHDIALAFSMETSGDARGRQPPTITVDLTKSYEQGAMENAFMYPDLPPRQEQEQKQSKPSASSTDWDRNKIQDFEL